MKSPSTNQIIVRDSHTRIRIIGFATILLVGSLDSPFPMLAQPPRGAIERVQKARVFDFKVTNISPDSGLLEHQSIQVKFELSVTLRDGAGDLQPISAAVCPTSNKGSCFVISDVQFRTYTGVIDAQAPAASAKAPVKIQLVTPPPCTGNPTCMVEAMNHFDVKPVANITGTTTIAEIALPVAAQYEIGITRLEIIKTRAKNLDTIKISLRSGLQGHPVADGFCDVVGANFCAINVAEGDHGTIGGSLGPRRANLLPIDNVRVGRYNLIPEVSDNLVFQYDVMNLGEGYNQETTQEILDTMSLAAAGILNVLMNSNGIVQNKGGGDKSSGSGPFDKLDEFAHQIHGLDKCDGPLAVDGQVVLNKVYPEFPDVQTLDVLTRDSGVFTPFPKTFEGTNSGAGCGENSLYRVTWSIFRTSWQP